MTNERPIDTTAKANDEQVKDTAQIKDLPPADPSEEQVRGGGGSTVKQFLSYQMEDVL